MTGVGEAAFPNSECNFWFGLFVPAKTPPQIIQRLYEETDKALRNPQVRMPMTSLRFTDYVRNELDQNARLAKSIGSKPE